MLEPEQILSIFAAVRETFCLLDNPEITIEMNPGTVTEEKLRAYKKAGVNRLSIGLQSVNDEELKAWIIRVTTNLCHSRYRNPFVRKRAELEEYEWEQMSCYDTGEQDYINRKVVMDAVLSLPDRYRIIVYLYYYEEYSCRQISSILQLKETTVQTRLARAREKLKCLLQSSFPEKGDSNGF